MKMMNGVRYEIVGRNMQGVIGISIACCVLIISKLMCVSTKGIIHMKTCVINERV